MRNVFASLDYDGTYLKDPSLWVHFIRDAQSRGREVVCITDRPEDQPVEQRLSDLVKVYYTDGKAKKDFAEKYGMDVHIWIDNRPKSVFRDK